jgi:hypothetical protein
MWDFVMDKSGAGAGFLRELLFPLPIFIPTASPQSSSLSPEAGTIDQEWPQCQQPHKPELKKNYYACKFSCTSDALQLSRSMFEPSISRIKAYNIIATPFFDDFFLFCL